jgi:hypothetical protein
MFWSVQIYLISTMSIIIYQELVWLLIRSTGGKVINVNGTINSDNRICE